MVLQRGLRSEKGLTTFEVIIAVVLLTSVITVAYSLQNYGITTFSRTEQRSTNQQQVRFASKFLSDEIRFAKEVEISSNAPSSVSDNWVYLYEENGKLVKHTKDGKQYITDCDQAECGFSLEFAKGDNDKLLKITIKHGTGQNAYEMKTALVPLNFEGVISGTGRVLRIIVDN